MTWSVTSRASSWHFFNEKDMSIASAIQRLQQASADIATAITDKGGVVNSGDGFEEFPADIRTIPTGSGAVDVTITASVTSTSVTLTLDKAIPVDLAVVFTFDGTTTNYTILAGQTTLVISGLPSYGGSRTATISITATSYATLFSISYPSSVVLPNQRRQVNLVVSNVTSTGCDVTADDYPSSDLTLSVSLGGSTYTGIIYNDGLTCHITWNAPSTSQTAYISVSPSSDAYADYVLDVTDFQVPASAQTYTLLTYIEGTGTQYIQTDITTALGMKIVSKFWGQCPNSATGGTNGDGQTALWSGGNQYNVLQYATSGARLYAGNGSFLRYRANNVGYTQGRYLKLLVNIDGGTAASASRFGYNEGTSESIFNDSTFYSITGGSNSQTPTYGDIYIFRYPSKTYPTPAKFYGLEITENNVVTHNLVPAMRDSDGVVGVLDQTTNTFYTNAGTGTFLYE